MAESTCPESFGVRSSDSKAWPQLPWSWTPPRPGWPTDSTIESFERPTKRTQQKRKLSEQLTEPASAEEVETHCLFIQAAVKRRAADIAYWQWRQLWSPGHFSFCSDSPVDSASANESFDDSPTMSSDDVCSPSVTQQLLQQLSPMNQQLVQAPQRSFPFHDVAASASNVGD